MPEETLPASQVTASPGGSTSVGVGLGAGVINSALGLVSQFIQNRWNEKMWERQTEYNSPIQQKQRLIDAGLNPALMYSNGSVSTGNASAPPRMDLNLGSILDGLQIASVASQIKQNNFRNKVLAAQARQINAQADYLEDSHDDKLAGLQLTNSGKQIANTFKELQSENQRFVNEHQAELFAQNMENLQQSILQKMASTANTSARTRQINQFLDEQFPEMVRLISASADLAEAKAKMQVFLEQNQGLSYYSNLIEGYLGTIFQGIGAFTKIPGLGGKSPVKNNYIDIDTGELLNP